MSLRVTFCPAAPVPFSLLQATSFPALGLSWRSDNTQAVVLGSQPPSHPHTHRALLNHPGALEVLPQLWLPRRPAAGVPSSPERLPPAVLSLHPGASPPCHQHALPAFQDSSNSQHLSGNPFLLPPAPQQCRLPPPGLGLGIFWTCLTKKLRENQSPKWVKRRGPQGGCMLQLQWWWGAGSCRGFGRPGSTHSQPCGPCPCSCPL